MKMKLIISGIMLTLLCLLGGCDDKLEVQQAYDFSLTSWYLQKTISPDETVEIRLTLNRSGNYEEAGYQIGYIQMEGSGEGYDKNLSLAKLVDYAREKTEAAVAETLFGGTNV